MSFNHISDLFPWGLFVLCANAFLGGYFAYLLHKRAHRLLIAYFVGIGLACWLSGIMGGPVFRWGLIGTFSSRTMYLFELVAAVIGFCFIWFRRSRILRDLFSPQIKQFYDETKEITLSARMFVEIDSCLVKMDGLKHWIPLRALLYVLPISAQDLASIFGGNPRTEKHLNALGAFRRDMKEFRKLAQLIGKPIRVLREYESGHREYWLTANPDGSLDVPGGP